MRSSKQILEQVVDTLRAAQVGLEDARAGDPVRRSAGIRNLVVFGRAVTNVLQNLRATEPEFDKWYEPRQRQMRGDPLLRYFYELRTQILKRGELPTNRTTHVRHFDSARDMRRMGPPPKGAKGFFIGDRLGGSGWEVELPDGTTERFYVNLPPEIGVTVVTLLDAPTEHLGQPLGTSDPAELGQRYIDYLTELVRSARATFG